MTRQTFKRFTRTLLLAAALTSTAAPAYFAVSVPANALTMSGVGSVNAPAKQTRTDVTPPGRNKASANDVTSKSPRDKPLRAGLRLPAR